jgi:hypothetical protein
MYKIVGADGKEYGPITADQLRQWIAEGRANAQTKVLVEGATDWKPLLDFPEFSTAVTGAAMPPLTPGPIQVVMAPVVNPMAITGMVLGIISITFGLCCCHGFPFSVSGIIFSSIGLAQINKDPQHQQGKGMAVAGLVLSIMSVLLGVVLLLLGLALSLPEILHKVERL